MPNKLWGSRERVWEFWELWAVVEITIKGILFWVKILLLLFNQTLQACCIPSQVSWVDSFKKILQLHLRCLNLFILTPPPLPQNLSSRSSLDSSPALFSTSHTSSFTLKRKNIVQVRHSREALWLQLGVNFRTYEFCSVWALQGELCDVKLRMEHWLDSPWCFLLYV